MVVKRDVWCRKWVSVKIVGVSQMLQITEVDEHDANLILLIYCTQKPLNWFVKTTPHIFSSYLRGLMKS